MLDALAAHPWAYPALEVIHLLGVALLRGNEVVAPLHAVAVACLSGLGEAS